MTMYKSSMGLIGGTPILALSRYGETKESVAQIFAKLEMFNPGGSVKDRVAAAIIKDAEESGRLQPGGTIIEATSGNTGIGLVSLGVAAGYRVIIAMPETMSAERRNIIKAYGGDLVLTAGALGMKGAIAEAERLAAITPNSILAKQFENKANPRVHYETTGPEIWKDMSGDVDIFVAGVGTGGTISGVGKFLREQSKNVQIVAVEPANSPVLTTGKSGSHKIQGIGAGFIPKTLDSSIYDEVITVADEDAFTTAAEIGRSVGILVGISSGAALWAAMQLAGRIENKGKRIVVLCPDTGERYLSMQEN